MARKRTIAGVIVVVCALVALLMPWRTFTEHRLIALLEAQGVKNVQLQVAGIGLTSLVLQNVSIGEEVPFTFKNLTVDYSPLDLVSGHIGGASFSNLMLGLHKQQGAWNIAGLEHLQQSGGGSSFAIPVTADGIPLAAATVKDSHLHIQSDVWQGDIPLSLKWTKSPAPTLDYTGSGLSWKSAGIAATAGDSTFHVTLNEKEKIWKGTWEVKNIAITGLPFELPATQSSGMLTAEATRIALQGTWGSADGAYKATFSLNYLLAAPERSTFTLSSFIMKWNGGIISLKDTVIPLSGMKAYSLAIAVKTVSVDALLQPLTGKHATATGTVSGTIPLTIGTDGSITLNTGTLQSEQPGTIVMAADAIPGDNAQIGMLRDVLKDFHYKMLSLTLDNDKNHKLSATLALEGNNPAMYGGRPVKLNVHLAGDVLDFIQQSMAINDPQQLLKQGKNAK